MDKTTHAELKNRDFGGCYPCTPHHLVNGVTVRVTGVSKTVADCFKYRNKIGLDVALEALRKAWHGKHMISDDIWYYAKGRRVANVMRPYLESLA